MEYGQSTLRNYNTKIEKSRIVVPMSERRDLYLALSNLFSKLHKSGITFCDIKPAHILYAPSRKDLVRLIDFGSIEFGFNNCRTSTLIHAPPEFRYSRDMANLMPESLKIFSVAYLTSFNMSFFEYAENYYQNNIERIKETMSKQLNNTQTQLENNNRVSKEAESVDAQLSEKMLEQRAGLVNMKKLIEQVSLN